jgi:hypothetical protein
LFIPFLTKWKNAKYFFSYLHIKYRKNSSVYKKNGKKGKFQFFPIFTERGNIFKIKKKQ